MSLTDIRVNVGKILAELPEGVRLLAAAKSREPAEVLEAVRAGVTIIGENYVQEAEKAYSAVGNRAEWHFIGKLQSNKVKKAVSLFDMIETLDSHNLAKEINRRCEQIDRIMPVLIEVNSGRELQKSGVFPEAAEDLVRKVSGLNSIRVMGLMTLGPLTGSTEDPRFYFRETRRLFEHLGSLDIAGVEMKYLSMGMTGSYRAAIDEGANIVRIGTLIFGERVYH